MVAIFRAAALATAAMATAALATACSDPATSRQDSTFAGAAVTIRVAVDRDLTETEAWSSLLRRVHRDTDITVAVTPVATADAATQIATGKVDGRYDAALLASDTALPLALSGARQQQTPAGTGVERDDRIAWTQVALGLTEPAMTRLHWDPAKVSWSDIGEACAAGRLTFGMGDPATSNAGLAALVAVATAVSGNGAALRPEQVPAATQRLRNLFAGQSLKSDSTRNLVDQFVQAQTAEAAVDGLIADEATLLGLNAANRLSRKLTVVYPSDGTLATELTGYLLASAKPQAKDGYRRLVGYLRSSPVQQQIRDTMSMRPAVASVDLGGTLPAGTPFRLPFPDSPQTLTDLVEAYHGRLRRPARTVYLLDVSGSMAGERLDQLRAAFAALTDPAGLGTGRTFQEREQITLLPFRGQPQTSTTFDVPAADPAPVLAQIRSTVEQLRAGGSTGIFDALVDGYTAVRDQAAADPQRISSIVLLTDGRNTSGQDADSFARWHGTLPRDLAAVPVFPILFGDADRGELEGIARLTGGRLFDGTGGHLGEAFGAIRGSQ